MGRHVEHGDLQDISCYHFKTPDHHHLAGHDPAHRLGHHDAAQDPHQGDHEAQHPLPDVPVVEHGVLVHDEDTDDADNESANTKPEDKNRVVDMLCLPDDKILVDDIIQVAVTVVPRDDDDPCRECGNSESSDNTDHIITSITRHAVIMVTVESVVSRVRGSWEQERRPGENHHSCKESHGNQHPPGSTVVLQDDAGENLENDDDYDDDDDELVPYHGEGGGGEEDGSAVSQGHSSHSFEYCQQ